MDASVRALEVSMRIGPVTPIRLVLLVLTGVALAIVPRPAGAHFVITSPGDGAIFAPGDPVEVGIDVLVHHDPGERFDILFEDDTGATIELAAGLDDTRFPVTVTLPAFEAPHASLAMIQHGPEGYRYAQRITIHVVATG